ncbi:exodeoxyribonuclease 7 large subunit [bacterium BMS3Abin13]|nr:exodeoxyribonuclease 7 large subunit [bacterium BMS3Abin13]
MKSLRRAGQAPNLIMDSPRIFTVSELTASIRGLLETQFPFVSVAGEISNLRQPYSGHFYFTLKDDRAQIKAVLFKMQQRYLSDRPVDGQQVVCRGRLSVYEPRGDYQLIVDTLDFHGAGAMQLAFENLKKRLATEGLFAEDRKKPLPLMPEHITLVTSPNGAAVHDFIRVARSRCPQTGLAVYPVAVQGEQAAGEIAAAIVDINTQGHTDLIVLCRGGGSLEDLWAFNEEKLARAIAASRLPIVSAVGHEIDFTIADFAADLRAPTPSAAAELILPDSRALALQVNQLRGRLYRTMSARLERYASRTAMYRQQLGIMRRPLEQMLLQLDHSAGAMERAVRNRLAAEQERLAQAAGRLRRQNPLVLLQLRGRQLVEQQRRLHHAAAIFLENRDKSLARIAGVLDAVSPLSTLARGYSIVRKAGDGGEIITDYNQVEKNSRIEVILHRGYLECTVEKTGEKRTRPVEKTGGDRE